MDIDTRKCISDAKEESRPDSSAVCLHCGQYLGCHTYIGRLSKFPLCRKEFQCVKWNNDLLKKPLFFPGIEEFFDIPVSLVPNPPASLDLKGYDTDDTLPAVSGA